MHNDKIDFIISWVDGNNQEWLKEKNKYLPKSSIKFDTRKQRFRDWNNLKYLFRGIEKNASWVNHVYLVTPGHYPEWLNLDNPKLTLINQSILFANEYLPTFNNCAVEILLHKIPGLSERFVYFNDDMFILNSVTEDDFFKNGLPLDNVGFAPIQSNYNSEGKGTYGISVMNTRVIAKRFSKKEIFERSRKKFLNIRNGKDFVKTLLMMPFPELTGFNETHTANSYLKSTFDDIWNEAEADLMDTVQSRFRGEFNVSQWCIRYWQIATGNFEIRSAGFSRFFDIASIGDEIPVVAEIKKSKHQIICINDNVKNDEEFLSIVKNINDAFEVIYPNKSTFEK